MSEVLRSAHHIPPGILRISGGEEVVGTVCQTTLAGHHRHLPEGPAGGGSGGGEGEGQDDQEDHHQVYPPRLHPLYKKELLATLQEIPEHGDPDQDGDHQEGRGDENR